MGNGRRIRQENPLSARCASDCRVKMFIASLVVALACVFALMLSPAGAFTDYAFADEADAVSAAAVDDQGEAAADAGAVQPDADGAVVVQGVVIEDDSASADTAAESQQIADDENPMAYGVDNHRAGAPIYAITIAAIAVVVVFFANSTHRVNTSIASMNHKIH